VTISNEFLAMAPDHPLAVELYDLIGLQGVVLNQQNEEATLVNAGRDRTAYDRLDIAMGLVNDKIEAVQKKYRMERGADEACRVGLTYARGFPVVDGRRRSSARLIFAD
jgi:hypothetical protein